MTSYYEAIRDTPQMQQKLHGIKCYFPSTIKRQTESGRQALGRVFSYAAEEYDLSAYEKIVPGFGRRIWDIILKEEAHPREMLILKQKPTKGLLGVFKFPGFN